MRLNDYSNSQYVVGASSLTQILWYYVGSPLVASSWLPFSGMKALLLKLFGAKIGSAVVIKPGVKIKYPWKISIGDASWIGEAVWFDSIGRIDVGSNVCISQGVYLCSGSHNWRSEKFDLLVQPVVIEDKVWLAAQSRVAPGVSIASGTVLTFGSVATHSLDAWKVYSGNPAVCIKTRAFSKDTSCESSSS